MRRVQPLPLEGGIESGVVDLGLGTHFSLKSESGPPKTELFEA